MGTIPLQETNTKQPIEVYKTKFRRCSSVSDKTTSMIRKTFIFVLENYSEILFKHSTIKNESDDHRKSG